MCYRFSGFVLDEPGRTLLKGRRPVAIEPKVFDLLAYLVRHRDRVVLKEELIKHLWVDVFVSDWALSKCIARARRAIGDSDRPTRAIRTFHGRGFRFVTLVESGDRLCIMTSETRGTGRHASRWSKAATDCASVPAFFPSGRAGVLIAAWKWMAATAWTTSKPERRRRWRRDPRGRKARPSRDSQMALRHAQPARSIAMRSTSRPLAPRAAPVATRGGVVPMN